MPEIIEVPMPIGGPPYQIGARLLAVLAHPPRSSADIRWCRAERALGRLVWEGRKQDDLKSLDKPQLAIPSHLMMPESIMWKEEVTICRALQFRMGAAHVVIPYLREASRQGESGREKRRHSVDDRILRTLEQEDEGRETLRPSGRRAGRSRFPEDQNNFDARVLRPSLPVIHLAAAVAVAIDASQKAARGQRPPPRTSDQSTVSEPQIHVGDILATPGLAASIIRAASEFEMLLPHLRVLRPRRIIRLALP